MAGALFLGEASGDVGFWARSLKLGGRIPIPAPAVTPLMASRHAPERAPGMTNAIKFGQRNEVGHSG